MQNIDNKIVVVTGASSGIGRAIAIELAGHGARVVLSARGEAALSQVVNEITASGGQAVAKIAEVHRRDDVAALVDYAVATYGRLDVFVCNAGIAPISPLADLRVDDWDAMVDVNLKGALNAVAAALLVFLDQGSGHFVFTVSTAGLVMIPSMAVYAATKNAVRTLVEGLRIASEARYRVTGVSPGFVATNLAKSMPDENVRSSIEKTMADIALDPADIARAVGFAISQPSHMDVSNVVV